MARSIQQHGHHVTCVLIGTSRQLAVYNYTSSLVLWAMLEYELVDANGGIQKARVKPATRSAVATWNIHNFFDSPPRYMESKICLVVFIYTTIITCLECEKDICLFSIPNRANSQDQRSMEHLDKFTEACKFFIRYSSAMKFVLHSRPMYHRIMWSKLLMNIMILVGKQPST